MQAPSPHGSRRTHRALLPTLTLLLILPIRLSASAAPADSVRIGLVLPLEPSADPLSRDLLDGATLAVADANASSAGGSAPVRLFVRTASGPWGRATSSIVNLVFQDRVHAVIGGLEGRQAHLIEQIATKARLLYLTPWATEATVTDIRLPWVFRLTPDDDAQAVALARSVSGSGRRRLVTLHDRGSGCAEAEARFVGELSRLGHRPVARLSWPSDTARLRGMIEKQRPEDLVIFLDDGHLRLVPVVLRSIGSSLRLFGPLSAWSHLSAGSALPRTIQRQLVLPAAGEEAVVEPFRTRFQRRFGRSPSALAAYAYDAARLAIEATHRATSSRLRPWEALRQARLTGVTGVLSFEPDGNRTGPVSVGSPESSPWR